MTRAEQYIERKETPFYDEFGKHIILWFMHPEHAKTACEIAVLEERLWSYKNQLSAANINQQYECARILKEEIEKTEQAIKAKEEQ